MGLKPTKTKFLTLITKNSNNQTIKSTTTEDKIDTPSKTFKYIFTYDNTKPYFNESQKINVESGLKKHTNKTSALKTVSADFTNTDYTITKQDIKNQKSKRPR